MTRKLIPVAALTAALSSIPAYAADSATSAPSTNTTAPTTDVRKDSSTYGNANDTRADGQKHGFLYRLFHPSEWKSKDASAPASSNNTPNPPGAGPDSSKSGGGDGSSSSSGSPR